MYCKFEEVLGPTKKSRATMKKTNKAVQLKLELQWDEDISEKTEELEKVIFEIEQKMLRTNGVIHDE